MRLHHPLTVLITTASTLKTHAFTTHHPTFQRHHHLTFLSSSSKDDETPTTATTTATETSTDTSDTTETTTKPSSSTPPPTKKKLGLLTFDLDDTLYPVAPVIAEANEAFAKAMRSFGFEGIQPGDIESTGRSLREEMAVENPKQAVAYSHTEIRMMAIRKQMETVIFLRSLEMMAADEATPVSSLSPIIVNNAKGWASKEVSPSVVQAVYNSWEMERHHAGERHVYPDTLEVLAKIKEQHPDVIIGAITDGKANPMLMTFTLAPYFDFCMSWEDDMGSREKFFKELSDTGDVAQLKWIYEAALEKYSGLATYRGGGGISKDKATKVDSENVWVHVGDDLAYDVGGSAACGAKTILLELADKYGQTARHRFSDDVEQPSWSQTMSEEIKKRKKMNENAEDKVDKKLGYMSGLPDAINEILEGK